jgi:hypothetical protein
MQNAECKIQKELEARRAQAARKREPQFRPFLDSSFCILHSAFDLRST